MSDISKKDQRIIENAKSKGTPIFVLTAKDSLSKLRVNTPSCDNR